MAMGNLQYFCRNSTQGAGTHSQKKVKSDSGTLLPPGVYQQFYQQFYQLHRDIGVYYQMVSYILPSFYTTEYQMVSSALHAICGIGRTPRHPTLLYLLYSLPLLCLVHNLVYATHARTHLPTAINHRSIIVICAVYTKKHGLSLPSPTPPTLTLSFAQLIPLGRRRKKPQGRKGCSQMAQLHSYWLDNTGKPGECGDVFCTVHVFCTCFSESFCAFGPLRPGHSCVPWYSDLHAATP